MGRVYRLGQSRRNQSSEGAVGKHHDWRRLGLYERPQAKANTKAEAESQAIVGESAGCPNHSCRSNEWELALVLTFLQQLLQITLPDDRIGVRAVPARLIGDGHQHEASVLHLFDLALRNPELRRIDKVIGEVHEHHVRDNLIEMR